MARPIGSKNKPKDGFIETATQDVVGPLEGEGVPIVTVTIKTPDGAGTVENPSGLPFKFTGAVRTMECVRWNGHSNFYNLTMWFENGVLVRKLYSPPYALFDAIQHMDLEMHVASLNLNTGYAPGLAWRK